MPEGRCLVNLDPDQTDDEHARFGTSLVECKRAGTVVATVLGPTDERQAEATICDRQLRLF